jgi:hypothetical protein
MSESTITRAFVQQFSDQLIMLAEQSESRLLPHVTVKKVNAKFAHFDRLGSLDVEEKTSRHSVTPIDDAPHSRRRVRLKDYHKAVGLDKEDELRMLIDPKSSYAKRLASAFGREMDRVIIAAAIGNSESVDGDDAGSNVALPSAQVVDEDQGSANSNLTVEKLREARRILMAANVDLQSEKFICVVNASALDNLLSETEVTSADYNTVKALVSGEVDTFLGFKFVHCELISEQGALSSDSDPKIAIIMCPSAIGFAMGKDVEVRIDQRSDLSYMHQVYASSSFGAVRIEEEKVVKIECYQTA